MARRVISPQAAARSTLGSGRHTTTKAAVSAPPSTAVTRSGRASLGARPPRSARRARPGGPISRISTRERLEPLTAVRWVRSVASNASCRSTGIREVSPTTRPGSRDRASGGRPSVASRSPSRSPPATRCARPGGPTTRGGPRTDSTAAIRSPGPAAGASRACASTRVPGSKAIHLRAGWRTMSRTGVRTWVVVPFATTRTASASTSTASGARAAPRTCGRISRGSAVSRNSTHASACSAARAGTGPRCRSAACSPATAADVTAQNATVAAVAQRRASAASAAGTAAAHAHATASPGAARATAAASQAARAGATRRRSGGPSWRGFDAPLGDTAAACTAGRAVGAGALTG